MWSLDIRSLAPRRTNKKRAESILSTPHLMLIFRVLLFIASADAADDPENGNEDNQDDNKEEPDRAEEDELLDGRDFVEDFDGLADAEDAEGWRAFPGGGIEALGLREDNVFVGFFFVSVDFFVAEERKNLERVGSGGIDIASVLDE